MVLPMVACVTVGLVAPGVQDASGSTYGPATRAWHEPGAPAAARGAPEAATGGGGDEIETGTEADRGLLHPAMTAAIRTRRPEAKAGVSVRSVIVFSSRPPWPHARFVPGPRGLTASRIPAVS